MTPERLAELREEVEAGKGRRGFADTERMRELLDALDAKQRHVDKLTKLVEADIDKVEVANQRGRADSLRKLLDAERKRREEITAERDECLDLATKMREQRDAARRELEEMKKERDVAREEVQQVRKG